MSIWLQDQPTVCIIKYYFEPPQNLAADQPLEIRTRQRSASPWSGRLTIAQQFLWEMLYHSLYVPEGEQALHREVVDRPEVRRYVEGWGRQGDIGFAATELSSGEVVGAAWLRVLTEVEPGYGYVDDHTPELGMAVVPEHRGRGVGSALLRHLLASVETVYQSVSLSVSADNPAVRLYRRMGFEEISANGASLTMIKRLSGG